MRGFHSIWSKPYCDGNNANEFWMQDYDLLTMIMSALMWRRENGPILLMADNLAIEYIKSKGLDSLWDLGIKEFTVPDSINPAVFWAAGKIYALKNVEAPFVMVDLDLIIWRDVMEYISPYDIAVIHREDITNHVYPPKEFFNMSKEYCFKDEWDWGEMPCNTAMLYLKNDDFKNYYVEESIKFMTNSEETNENLCNMVFAEQRLISMCAKEKKQEIGAFFHTAGYINNQDIFTHIWGHKNILKFNYDAREAFCKKLVGRIISEFPEFKDVLKGIEEIRKYI